MRLTFVSIFFFLFALPVAALAQDVTVTTAPTSVVTVSPTKTTEGRKPTRTITPPGKKMGEIKDEIKSEKLGMKGTITQERGETKEAMQETKQEAKDEFRQNRFEWIIQRFEAAVNRLKNILGRIESRMLKIGTEANTVESKKHIAAAKTHIASIETALAALRAELPTLLEESGTDVQQTAFHTKLRPIKEELFETHAELRLALTSLMQSQPNKPTRTISPKMGTSPTATPSTTIITSTPTAAVTAEPTATPTP